MSWDISRQYIIASVTIANLSFSLNLNDMKLKRYKIVPSGIVREEYQIEIWRWYWPFWVQVGFCLEFKSIEEAKKYIDKLKNPVYY